MLLEALRSDNPVLCSHQLVAFHLVLFYGLTSHWVRLYQYGDVDILIGVRLPGTPTQFFLT